MRVLAPVLALAASALVAGCGERIRYADTVRVPMTVPGAIARETLRTRLSPALIQQLGGDLPETWPEDAPRVTDDLPLVIAVPVSRSALADVGQDFADVELGEAEARLRAVEMTFAPGTLNHPVVAGVVHAGPRDLEDPEDGEARRVGYLTGFDSGSGELVFDPGGRRALARQIVKSDTTLLLELLVAFDTDMNPDLPAGEGTLELVLRVDVLR